MAKRGAWAIKLVVARALARRRIHEVEQGQVHRLRLVDDHVADAAEAFLSDLQPLVISGGDNVGVARSPSLVIAETAA